MTAVLDPFRPFSAELYTIRRLNSSLYRSAGRDGREPGCVNSSAQHTSLAPHREDIPLLDPSCGQLSAGAEVALGVKGRQKFIDFHHVASGLRVPPDFRERPQTTPNSFGICMDLSEDKAWNSRRIPDAAIRARLSASDSLKTSMFSSSFPDKHTGAKDALSSDLRLWTDNSLAVRRFRYTSATQRSYEEVDWDSKLPRSFKAPATTREKMADPVSEHPSSRRYNSQPQLWQSIGAEWSRQQLRSRNDARKPISFGKIGSQNMDNIDNMEEDFHPLTLKRSIVPPYTPTAHRTTIPGYTGKAVQAHLADDAAGSVCSWAPVERTLPAFGAGSSRWLNPEQLVVIVVFTTQIHFPGA
ncbi:spermatogenesis-associated protein 48 [Scomber japonicus]|uniref:spermatogenesis-associated protein 48 n=1 Tax=Scomber japonicus TaxID=13676 RepID=UPI0023063064|nr:spermatogenesis-associated protein 48 [Scomber japonicus]